MATGNGIRGGRGFLTEDEKQNKPRITGVLLKRIFSYGTIPWLEIGVSN